MKNNLHILSAFVAKHLPDSIHERREVLWALLSLLPASHPDRPLINSMSVVLDRHMQLQQEFLFPVKEAAK